MKCLWFVFHVPNIAFLHIWLYQIPAEVLKLSNQTFKKLFFYPFVLRTDLTENKKVSFCIQVLQTVSLKLKAELKWWQGTYSEIATRHALSNECYYGVFCHGYDRTIVKYIQGGQNFFVFIQSLLKINQKMLKSQKPHFYLW